MKKSKYTIDNTDGNARAATFETVHGTIQTPVFMNVATVAAIKGAVSTADLKEIGTQVMLCNTYHLHVRTGDETIKKLHGLHTFTNWDRPILTDSGGFQVFSLASLRKIKEEGVTFNSHIDGHRIFMGPEESMQIQSNLGSTIAMAFDECPSSRADRKYVEQSVARTERWLIRSKAEIDRLNSLPDTVNPDQLLFGINQGACFEDIRIRNADHISGLDLDGYAIGGLAVGESHEEDSADTADNQQDEGHVPTAGALGYITEDGVGEDGSTQHIAHEAGEAGSGTCRILRSQIKRLHTDEHHGTIDQEANGDEASDDNVQVGHVLPVDDDGNNDDGSPVQTAVAHHVDERVGQSDVPQELVGKDSLEDFLHAE